MSPEPSPDEFVAELRHRLTRVVESDPQVLLEHDGGPESLKADLILATLYGHDDQIDHEWRLQTVVPVLRAPIVRRVRYFDLNTDATSPGPMPVARYNLQSGYATMKLDWTLYGHMLPADIEPDRGTYLVDVALVRYRREVQP